MADSIYKIRIQAVDDTKKAFDSIKKNSQVSGPGTAGIPGGRTSATSELGNLSVRTARKGTEKQLSKIVSLLDDISKELKEGLIVSGTDGGGPTGRGRGGRGKGFLGGFGGKLGLGLGIAGGALALGGFAYSQMNKMAEGYRGAAKPQLSAIQQLGIGGFFGGSRQYGKTGTEEAEFMKQISSGYDFSAAERAGVIKRTGTLQSINNQALKMFYGSTGKGGAKLGFGERDFGQMGGSGPQLTTPAQYEESISRAASGRATRRMRSQFKTAAQLSSIYGMNLNQLGGTAANLQKFGIGDDLGLGGIGGFAKSIGMSGARTNEFFSKFSEAMESAVKSGSSSSNRDMLRSFTLLMGAGGEREREQVPAILNKISETSKGASLLQGGADSSMMLAAFLEQTGGDLRSARKMAANAQDPQNVKTLFKYYTKNYGNEMGGLMLARSGLLGNIKDPDKIDSFRNKVITGKIKPTTEAFKAEMESRERITGEITQQLTSKDISDQIGALNKLSGSVTGLMSSIDELRSKGINLIAGSDVMTGDNIK